MTAWPLAATATRGVNANISPTTAGPPQTPAAVELLTRALGPDTPSDEAGTQQRAKLTIEQMPVRLDARGRERHRKNVESVQHVESDAERDYSHLKGCDCALREPALQVLTQGGARRLTLKPPTRL
jgi:hypothetical protein